jgi:hypothetical protein
MSFLQLLVKLIVHVVIIESIKIFIKPENSRNLLLKINTRKDPPNFFKNNARKSWSTYTLYNDKFS